ncbi:MAG: radical SAM protein [Acidobacteriota bacterium]
MGPTGKSRIVQIHPTRQCNLRCLHCYSSSGPEQRGEISPRRLRSLMAEARVQGYSVVGFSGGEPLLYSGLRESLTAARELGLFTTVTSNGMLLDKRRLAMLEGRLGLLAISLDGSPESHNRMRANPRAFEAMERRLDGVRGLGIPFGFIFTLTQYNLDELLWVARFALEQGASLLQIHPLEITGRAAEELSGSRPDPTEAGWAYVAATNLQRSVGDALRIQLDLFDREALRLDPERVFAGDRAGEEFERPLGEVLSPLVVEADGTLVPMQYGFSRSFALGNLHHEGFSLAAAAVRWRRHLEEEFRSLCRSELAGLLETADDLPISNWYERLAERAAAWEGERNLLAIGA